MHPQRIQMVTLVHFVKARHISRLHYQSVSGVVLPLGSQPELSLWGEPTRLLHCDGKYVPGKLNPGEGQALKNKGFQILCEVLLLQLVYPRSGQTQQLLRPRSIELLFSILDPCRVFNP